TCSPAANTTTQSNAARKWASSSTPQNDQGVPQMPNDDLAKLKAAGTTYARAAAGYDDAHKDRLISKITAAIFNTSLLSARNAPAPRPAQPPDALATPLAFTLAMSPDATRSPTAIRQTVNRFSKYIHRKIAAAKNDPEFQQWTSRLLHPITPDAGKA